MGLGHSEDVRPPLTSEPVLAAAQLEGSLQAPDRDAGSPHVAVLSGDKPWWRQRSTAELAVIVALAVLVAVGIRTFVFQLYVIPSVSMESTLHVGDRVLVDKLSYDFHSVHRGDVIVFKRPPADTTGDTPYLIKRVIGLPGETVQGQGGYIYIDGRRLIELWLPADTTTANFPPVHVPPGEYFVMGDNRSDSFDSRQFGPIPKGLIEGRAFLIVWSPSHLGGL